MVSAAALSAMVLLNVSARRAKPRSSSTSALPASMAMLLPRPRPSFSIGCSGCSSALPPIFPIAVLGRFRCDPANTDDCADDGRPTNPPVADAGRSRAERAAGMLGTSPEAASACTGVSAQESAVLVRAPLPSIAEDGRGFARADAGLVEGGPPAIAEAGRAAPGRSERVPIAVLGRGNDAFCAVPDRSAIFERGCTDRS